MGDHAKVSIRMWVEHNVILLEGYFDPNLSYDENCFCCHFWICHSFFDHILSAVVAHDRYFIQKKVALGLPGFSPHQKLTCALCFLAYGTSADKLDEYIWIAETTVLETVSRFCSAIIACFSDTYLHSPTVVDLKFFNQLRESRLDLVLGLSRCHEVAVEKLPNGMERHLSRQRKGANSHLRGYSWPSPVVLASILWYAWC